MKYVFDGPDDVEAVEEGDVVVMAEDYANEFGNVECDDHCSFWWRKIHDSACVLYSEADYKAEQAADREVKFAHGE